MPRRRVTGVKHGDTTGRFFGPRLVVGLARTVRSDGVVLLLGGNCQTVGDYEADGRAALIKRVQK